MTTPHLREMGHLSILFASMFTMTRFKLIKLAVAVFCTCVALAFLFNKQDGYHSTRKLIHAGRSRLENAMFERIKNETLGVRFENRMLKIIY